jgi:heptosyltransferase-2
MSPSFPSRFHRILVLRYSSLGDVALTNPVLDLLHKNYPHAEILYATKEQFAPAVSAHPAVTQTAFLRGGGFFNFWEHLSQLRAFQPDLVVDLHDSLRTRLFRPFFSNARILVYDKEAVYRRLLVQKLKSEPSLHTINKYLKVLAPLEIEMPAQVHFEVSIAPEMQTFLRGFLELRKIGSAQQVVGLGPGSIWATKQWMPDHYAELASRLVRDDKALLFWFGSPDEKELIESIQAQMSVDPADRGIDLSGGFSLEQSIALLGRCDLFIGNDSGLMHLASGRGIRTVVIYGSTTTSLGFEPWGPHTVVENSALTCRPCDVHGKSECPLGHFKCMKELSVDLVEGAVKRSIRRGR